MRGCGACVAGRRGGHGWDHSPLWKRPAQILQGLPASLGPSLPGLGNGAPSTSYQGAERRFILQMPGWDPTRSGVGSRAAVARQGDALCRPQVAPHCAPPWGPPLPPARHVIPAQSGGRPLTLHRGLSSSSEAEGGVKCHPHPAEPRGVRVEDKSWSRLSHFPAPPTWTETGVGYFY